MSADVPSSEAEEHIEAMVDDNPRQVPAEEQDELMDTDQEEEEPIEEKESVPEMPLFLPRTAASTAASNQSSAAPSSRPSPVKDGTAASTETNGDLAPPSLRSLSSDPLEKRSRTASSGSAGPSRTRTTRSSAAGSPVGGSETSPRPPQYRNAPIVQVPLLPLRRIRNYSFPKGITPPSDSTRAKLPGIPGGRRSIYVVPEEDGSQDRESDDSDDGITWLSAPPAQSSRSATRNSSAAPILARRTRSTVSDFSSDFGGYGPPESEEGEDVESECSEEDTSDDPLAMRRTTRSNGNQRKEDKKRVTRSIRDPVEFCERCSRGPADELLEKVLKKKARAKPKKGKRRKKDEDIVSEEEEVRALEGWVECKTCVVNAHWGCLGEKQRYEIKHRLRMEDGPPREGERLRHSLYIHESTTFTCAKCDTDPECFVCHKERIEEGTGSRLPKIDGEASTVAQVELSGIGSAAIVAYDVEMADVPKDTPDVTSDNAVPPLADATADTGRGDVSMEKKSDAALEVDELEEEEPIEEDQPLKFRCIRCKLSAHYEHLKNPYPDAAMSPAALAEHYQKKVDGKPAWNCHLCREWIWTVGDIIAWRPSPPDAKEHFIEAVPDWKKPLPREYLVRWTGRGFRHVTWVPHLWLIGDKFSGGALRLRHFLSKGPALDLITDETLAARGDDLAIPTIARVLEEDDRVQGERGHTNHKEEDEWKWGGPPPDIDAESSVPKEWSTTDRILVLMLRPPPPKPKTSQKAKRKQKRVTRVLSDSGSEDSTPAPVKQPEYTPVPDGLEPPLDQQIDIDDWETKTGRSLTEADLDEVAGMVTWAYIKWVDLQHDQSTWDTPPPTTSDLYPAFKRALERFLRARRVRVPVLSRMEAEKRDQMAARVEKPPDGQPDCIKGGKLMPFQIEGFMWLVYNHFKRHSCILADDMGLGKTIQMASMLGYLVAYKVYPCLVIVPNSTITNWVREFEKWVPHVRVVPYYGEAASRKVISKYELYRNGLQGKPEGLKAHITLTTYDMITGGEFSVFRNVPRWEVLCIDEGQRLKNDNALIFNRLRQLNSVHRVLMTGTPLNNNIRELFNLLSFLDPANFTDLQALEEKFDQDNLDEAKVKELHEIVRPYILRRIKADVLRLPPKIETIIPISLAPLQKQVYKLILERNKDVLQNIVDNRRKRAKKVQVVHAASAVTGDGGDHVQSVERPAVTPMDGQRPSGTGEVERVEGDNGAAEMDDMVVDGPVSVTSEANELVTDAPSPTVALEVPPVSAAQAAPEVVMAE